MRWEQDLARDIRTHSPYDDVDLSRDLSGAPLVPPHPLPWRLKGRTFSQCNQEALLRQFLRVQDTCEFIFEIGVDRDGYDNSSTKILIETKKRDTIYLGVDITPKDSLDDASNNVHTLCCPSQNIIQVMEKIKEIGAGRLGFFMIDGWHSINQVLQEWEYTSMLAPNGIVGFHDTRYHPGPHLFVKHLDRTKWEVVEDACHDAPKDQDWGIGFAWKK